MKWKQLTTDQKLDLSFKFFGCSGFFAILGIALGVIAAAVKENTIPLILVAVCAVIVCIFGFLSIWTLRKAYNA